MRNKTGRGMLESKRMRAMHNNGPALTSAPRRLAIEASPGDRHSEAVARLSPDTTSKVLSKIEWLKGHALNKADAEKLEELHHAQGQSVYWQTLLAHIDVPVSA